MYMYSIRTSFAGVYTEFNLQTYVTTAWYIVSTTWTTFNAQMVNFYSLNYTVIFIYLNPYQWASWFFTQMTYFIAWIQALFNGTA